MENSDILLTEKVIDHIGKKYGVQPEHPWKTYPDYMVFRHEDNKKWFALIMNVSRAKLRLAGSGQVWIVNLKLGDLLLRDMLIQQEGILPGYHIRAGDWVSVLLDGSVEENTVFGLTEKSYQATASRKKQNRIRPPKEWIIPANPKYYDVVGAFEKSQVINWKQSGGVKSGDTVYMYVAAPVSAIMFKCLVTESDIPYNYSGEVSMKKIMKIKLLKKYDPDRFTFDVLKSEYGIFAVRGPRGIPNSLSAALDR